MPLLNAFIDSIVCVGFSSEYGLKLDSESKNNTSIFTSSLQPSLLTVVTAEKAIYPQSRGSEFIDPTYPPIDRQSSYASSTTNSSCDRSASISSMTVNLRTQKQHLVPAALNNLPLFCFPDGVRTTYQQENERIHHIVFTQEEGKRTYALALTFQQSFILKTNQSDEDGTFHIDDVNLSTLTPRRSSISKIPIPVNSQKVNLTSALSLPADKQRSRKMPSSFPSGSANSSSHSRSSSNDPNKQHNYEKQTISSYMKNLSPSSQPPTPRSRMVRTNSQSQLDCMDDNNSSNSAESRIRSNSNTPRALQMKTDPSNSTSSDIVKPFYLPHCIVLVSNQPYWTAMQETISLIYDEITRSRIEPSSNTYKRLIQKYAFLACNTPTPPMPLDRFSVSFNLTYDHSLLTLDPPIDMNHPVLDLDLSILPLTLNIGKLLDVLAVVFTQQPIIFFSSNYSTLVTALESLLYLIYPLKWIHVYVPFVPDGLREYYLEGPPGSYIMGAHSRHQSIVEDIDMSFTCNLDDDKSIHVPKTYELHHIPPSKLHRFATQITTFVENVKRHRSLQNLHTPMRLRIDQQRELERQQRIDTNRQLIKIFLDLMVDVCGDALQPIYWAVTHQQSSPTNSLKSKPVDNHLANGSPKKITAFSKEKYLLSKTEGVELEFYRSFVGSTAFQLLMDEEMKSKTPTVFRQLCQLHLSTNENQHFQYDNTLSRETHNQIEATTALYESLFSQMLLPLPDWSSNASYHYLDRCIEVFTNELHHAQNEHLPTVIAVYAYLRGCAYISRGRLMEGLRDLYLIESPSLFPRDYIETNILPRLSDEYPLDQFFHESFYLKSPGWKKVREQRPSRNLSILDLEKSGDSLDETTAIPSFTEAELDQEWDILPSHLTCEQFTEHVRRLGIVVDQETTETLFKALLHWTVYTDRTLTNDRKTLRETTRPLGGRRLSVTGSLREAFDRLNEGRGMTLKSSEKQSTQSNQLLSATLFELFLETWQQTNAEKARMSRYLPEDRQKQESILKVSSSDIISKNDGPGQIILTQKRLYFLPEQRSVARLLTEIISVTAIEKYQHQTVFSSSKPGIKIQIAPTSKTSSLTRDNNATLRSKSSTLERESKSLIRLLFKDAKEQDLWNIIITEIWSGVTIAHEQCDIALLNRASRHIVLMDTLANINYDFETMKTINKLSVNANEKLKQRRNEAALEKALNDFAIFTRMRKAGSLPSLPDETRNVLSRRLSPSINETERHAVRSLVFTEGPNNGHSSLWCAYGSKLKVFDVTTWVCDPIDILFRSLISCVCLDKHNKLWVGCTDGQLFVIDTPSHVCGPPLVSIKTKDGWQTIASDAVHDHILTADREGTVIIWNASNWERLNEINIYEIYKSTVDSQPKLLNSENGVKLRKKPSFSTGGNKQRPKNLLYFTQNGSMDANNIPDVLPPPASDPVIPSSTNKLERIQIYGNLLFACYRDDYILILRISDSNTYTYENLLSVKYKSGESMPIDSFIVYQNQVWVSASCIVHIFSVCITDHDSSCNLLMKKPVDDDHLTTMLGLSNCIWAGSLRGNIYVFRMDNYERQKTFTGHRDTVSSLCSIFDTYVISGSSQNDASIAIWENVSPPKQQPKGLSSSVIA